MKQLFFMKQILLFVLCLGSAVMLRAEVSKTLNVTSGGLFAALTDTERSTITSLTLTGTINARDFVTMRDNMVALTDLDLRNVVITSYTGTQGTNHLFIGGRTYPSNAIPMYAFLNPATELAKVSLSSIVLPNTVSTIELGAFQWCTGLKAIYIPPSVNLIDMQSFELSSCFITVDPDNSKYSSVEGILYDKEQTTLIHFPPSATGNYIIPWSVTTIERFAFGFCSGLTSITIPSTVTSIGLGAFSGCTGLTSIIIFKPEPLGLIHYPDCAANEIFAQVNTSSCSLKVPLGSMGKYKNAIVWKDFFNIVEMPEFLLSTHTLEIASGVGTASFDITTSASWSIISDQSWLTVNPSAGTGNSKIYFTAEENTSYFMRSAIVTVTISGVASQTIVINQKEAPRIVNISAGGLESALSAIELNKTSRLKISGTIDARDFKTMRDGMPLLTELDLSGVIIAAYTGTLGTEGTGNITYEANSIPPFAFFNNVTYKGKPSLIAVILPSSVISIKRNSFSQCNGLASLNIPGSVTSIEYFAFDLCTGLRSITIPSSVITIGFYAFRGCSGLATVSIPATLTNIQYEAFSECGFINVDAENPNYSSIDGILFNKAKTKLIHFPVSQSGSYSIPSSVSSIAQGAFRSCVNLTSVNIPNSVVSIEAFAFFFCTGLRSIYASSVNPVNLNSSTNAFNYVDKEACILYVPFGSKSAYQTSFMWQDFKNITEMPGLKASPNVVNISATQGSVATLEILSNVSWTISSDQTWITHNTTSGSGNSSITVTASENTLTSPRTAIITISGPGVDNQIIIINQAASVHTGLNSEETHSVTVKAFPNPTSGLITFIYQATNDQRLVDLDLYNSLGIHVMNLLNKVNETTIAQQFSLHILPKGTYFLVIRTTEQSFTKPIIIK